MEKLKDFRIFKKITQDEMAKMIDITRNYYTQLENGRYKFSDIHKTKISEILGVNKNQIDWGD